MNKALIAIFTILMLFSIVTGEEMQVLFIVPDNYGANMHCALEMFAQIGFKVTLTGVNQTVQACPSYGGPLGCPVIIVDQLIGEIIDLTPYDVIAITSGSHFAGNPCSDLINDPATLNLLNDALDQGKVILTECTASRVIAAADIINGKDITGHASYATEYTNAGANYLGPALPPVIDGTLVTTTRGQYYMFQDIEIAITALSEQIYKKEK